MMDDKRMMGVSQALSVFLHEQEQQPFAFVLMLVEQGHSGANGDETPVRIAVHQLNRNDVIDLLRATADKLSRERH